MVALPVHSIWLFKRMSLKIENEYLTVRINKKGAELSEVRNRTNHIDYLWNGDPRYWAKTSPVLFPIVGTLKDNAFLYRGHKYEMGRHGFARDFLFTVEDKAKNRVVFMLSENEVTLKHYPFRFELRLEYLLFDDSLKVTYDIRNTDSDQILFSIGGHPAFRTPLTPTSRYEDHYLQFSQTEDVDQWPLNGQGLIEKKPLPLLVESDVLRLTRELFYQDALVLKHLQSKSVSLKSRSHNYGIDFYFGEFPFLGIWAARDADFVCIEPWCGIADSVSHSQELVDKEGIQTLNPGDSWMRSWKARFF